MFLYKSLWLRHNACVGKCAFSWKIHEANKSFPPPDRVLLIVVLWHGDFACHRMAVPFGLTVNN